jgi:hypothetical protein
MLFAVYEGTMPREINIEIAAFATLHHSPNIIFFQFWAQLGLYLVCFSIEWSRASIVLIFTTQAEMVLAKLHVPILWSLVFLCFFLFCWSCCHHPHAADLVMCLLSCLLQYLSPASSVTWATISFPSQTPHICVTVLDSNKHVRFQVVFTI